MWMVSRACTEASGMELGTKRASSRFIEKIEGVFSVLFNGQRSDRTKEVDSIGAIPQNNCYCSSIRHTEVKEALRKMGRNKAVGRDEIPIEAWRCLGGEGVRWLTILFNKTFLRAKMPEEWRLSEVIPIYKNNGDAQTCSNYRGIKLLSHTMKLWESY
ncbi:hypothetical protein Tco_0390974 [Tanacetum coccineum]